MDCTEAHHNLLSVRTVLGIEPLLPSPNIAHGQAFYYLCTFIGTIVATTMARKLQFQLRSILILKH